MDNIRALYPQGVRLVDDAYEAAEGADALVMLTEWREYQNPDFERLGELMRQKVIFDGRNVWSSYKLAELGFVYSGVGTGSA
jgi:UDPglucose 6-dehydrogenase